MTPLLLPAAPEGKAEPPAPRALRRGRAALLLLAACAACAAPSAVLVTAAPVEGGVRVRFRRTKPGTGGHLARVAADAGRITEVVHSPDRRTVAVCWLEPQGELRCAFPYGGEAGWRPGRELVQGEVEYVFLENRSACVRAHLPRGCPIVSSIELEIVVEDALLPARLLRPGRTAIPLAERVTHVRFDLPRDADGALVGGDHTFLLEYKVGHWWTFRITVDPDGTPAAGSGYVRNW